MQYPLCWLLLLFPLVGLADIYQWTDANGIVHYSDFPSTSASTVHLAEDMITTDKALQLGQHNNEVNKVKSVAAPKSNLLTSKVVISPYTSLHIVQPENDATFFNNYGEVVLTIAAKPEVREEDNVVTLIDGAPVKCTRNATMVSIKDIERGSHTVQVQIQDKADKVLITSNTVKFQMHRSSILNSQNNKIKPLQKLL